MKEIKRCHVTVSFDQEIDEGMVMMHSLMSIINPTLTVNEFLATLIRDSASKQYVDSGMDNISISVQVKDGE